MAMKWAIAIMATTQSIAGAIFRASAKDCARCPEWPCSGHRGHAAGQRARLDLWVPLTDDHQCRAIGGHPNGLSPCDHDLRIGRRAREIRFVAWLVEHELVSKLDAVVRRNLYEQIVLQAGQDRTAVHQLDARLDRVGD